MNFYEMLNQLEQETGSNAKEEYLIHILKHVKNAEAFFRFTFNDLKYGVQEQSFKNAYPEYENTHEHISDWFGSMEFNVYPDETKVPDLIEFGKKLLSSSGNSQIIELRRKFDNLSSIKRKWFCRAILKDLRCGIQVRTMNKAFKYCGMKEIEQFSVQLCQKVDLYNEKDVKKKLSFPCSMECKYDGIRIQAEIISNGDDTYCLLTSRRGTDNTEKYPEIVNALREVFKGENIILDGEVISRSFQELTRKDSTSTKKYVIFDLLVDEQLQYKDRWDNLRSLCSERYITAYNDKQINILNNKNIFTAEHYSCNSLKEAQEYYEELNRRGEEGIIIKLDDKPYIRSPKKKTLMNMYKCKKVFDADLLCIGHKLGTGKRSGMVSTLELIDASKTIRVDVGSGIDDATSEYLTKQVNETASNGQHESEIPFIEKIVEIQFNEITETGSIRFPRFICFRDDKIEADDLSKEKVRQA